MKKSVWIICWLAVMACAEHIHWLGDYDTAHVKAKTEGKVLIVLLVNEECTACRDTLRDTLSNQPYIDRLNEKSVAVIVTYEWKGSYPIELFYSTVFPTLFVVDSSTESFIAGPLYGVGINPENLKKIAGGL